MKNKIHPLFWAYIILLIIMGQKTSVLVYFFCVVFHEFGHAFVAKKLGYKLNQTKLMPYGVCLNYDTVCFFGLDEIYIALAGPITNLFLAIFIIALWWLFPELYPLTQQFCYCNIVMVVFNMLPCYPLDGGRVIAGILSQKIERKKAVKICVVFNIIISCIFVIIFIFGLFINVKNFNLIIISIFLLGGILDAKNNSKYDYLKIKKTAQSLINKGIGVKHICVNSIIPIYKIVPKLSKNKFNIIYIILKNNIVKKIDENTFFSVAEKFPPNVCFEQIFALYK